MAPKKGRNEDLKREDVLQAVVIADSFNVRFGPITAKKPRALLPLVNVPLLDYTLEALSLSGVQEVFVFCCHLGDQVREHIKSTKWHESGSPMMVTTLMSDSCLSMGDALREIDNKSLIRSDFILITGDIVSNMDIGQVVKEHKARTQGKDKSSVMTMIFKVAHPGHRSRSREDDMFLVEEGKTHRLLYFLRAQGRRNFQLPMELLLDHDDIISHNDLLDSHISVCSALVPSLFTDNFDYQTRDDFVRGILIDEEIMGNKIHISITRDKYAARISNMQTYDAISKDVVSRWTYPFVPDMFGSCQKENIMYSRHNVYCSKDVTLSRGCELLKDVVVGRGTVIGSGTVISGCVIGKNCQIGQNVNLKNSFLWDNVTIKDNCEIDTALLCSCVIVFDNVVVKKGVILAWNVKVGPSVTIPQGTQLIAEPQTDEFDDSNLSFGDDEEDKNRDKMPEKPQAGENEVSSLAYGEKAQAFQYKVHIDSDEEDEVPVMDVTWGISASDSEDRCTSDSEDSQSDGEDDSDNADRMELSSEEDDADFVDPTLNFNPRACMMARNKAYYTELVDTFMRAKMEKIKDDNLILEVNSLKHAYTIPIDQLIHSLPSALYELAAKEHNSPICAQPLVLSAFKKNVERYSALLCKYVKNSETQLIAINGLGDLVIRHSDLRPRLPQLFNFFYDADVLSENIIISWFNSSKFTPGSDEALRHAFLKERVQPFIKWLQEAEEESSEEEEED